MAARADEFDQLARVFQHMARGIHACEPCLKQQVQKPRIELDEAKRVRQLAEITETDYFRQLKARVRELRDHSAQDDK